MLISSGFMSISLSLKWLFKITVTFFLMLFSSVSTPFPQADGLLYT